MSKRLFAENFLVAPTPVRLPEPDRYAVERGYSVTIDGEPFIEAGASGTETRTITEAGGEPSDDDRDRVLLVITKTEAGGEPTDRQTDAVEAEQDAAMGPALSTRTLTFTDAEGADDDRDRGRMGFLVTETKATGESPDREAPASHDQRTRRSASDRERSLLLATVTKTEGERET